MARQFVFAALCAGVLVAAPQAGLGIAVAGGLAVADGRAGARLHDATTPATGDCSLACTPSVPTTTIAGEALIFLGQYESSGCDGTPTYDWDFGDGTPHSLGPSPRHVYTAGGDYHWSLTVGLGGGSCTSGATIRVVSTLPPITNPWPFAYVVPTSAHKRGFNGTRWLTDLVLTNPGLADAVAAVYFMKGGQDNSAAAAHPVVVPLRHSVKLVDVVGATFLQSDASGAILVGCDAPLIVTSRTYDDTGAGSYGQGVEGVPLAQAIGAGQTAWLTQLAQSADATTGFRTNVGLACASVECPAVEVAFYRHDGTWIASTDVALPPFGFQQLDKVLATLTPDAVDDGYALVTVPPLASPVAVRFFAYASVIDNATGDPINVPAILAPSGPE